MQLKLERKAVRRIVRWSSEHYYLTYTISFVAVSLFVFSSVILNGKSLVNAEGDGLRQHFIALLYFSKWGKSILANFVSGNGLVFPMWDFSIGYGADVITTFNYYAIGDPLNLLSIICPTRYMEYLYSLLIVLRMFLSGLFFSMFCLRKKKRKFAVLACALAYAFSGWALQSCWSHPFFLNPLVYFPLLLLGFEKVVARENPALFILSVAVSLASNFYFFYMLIIVLAAYAVVRLVTLRLDKGFSTANAIGRLFLDGVIGVLLASVLFLPVLLTVLGTDRLSQPVGFSALYDLSYYASFPSALITGAVEMNWTAIGVAAPLFMGISALFVKGRKYRLFCICVIIATVAMLLPVIGRALNGFSYTSNRWSWAYVMLLTYAAATAIPEIPKLSKRESRILLVSNLAFCFLLILLHRWETEAVIASCAILLISLVVYISLHDVAASAAVAARSLVVLFTVIGIAINAAYVFSPAEDGAVSRLVDRGCAIAKLAATSAAPVAKLQSEEQDFHRFDQQEISLRNTPAAFGATGVQFYWSLVNGNVTAFLKEMALPNPTSSFSGDTLDSRFILENLSSVAWWAGKEGSQPHGYSDTGVYAPDGDYYYSVFKDDAALPLCYSYNKTMDREAYEKLPAYEKQEAVLEYAILDSGLAASASERARHYQELDFSLDSGEWRKQADGVRHQVDDAGSTITLDIKGMAESDIYLYIDDLKIDCEDSESLVSIPVSTETRSTKLTYLPADYRFTNGQSEYLLNIGPLHEGLNSVDIYLPTPGTYEFGTIKVVAEPWAWASTEIEKRKSSQWDNESIVTNRVSGTVNAPEDSMLCFAIPYDKGWTAFVDGKEVGVTRVNTIFCGVWAEEGAHEIVLQYETHGIRIGLILFIVGLCGFAIIELRRIKGFASGKRGL